jgi:hypothetical protein
MDAAEPLTLVALPTVLALEGLDALNADFENLKTFADGARWRAEAARISDAIGVACRKQLSRADQVRGLITNYQTTNHDRPHIAAAKIAKTEKQLSMLYAFVARLTALYEPLSERVDVTPQNATEQRSLLKDLRAQRKDIGARKPAAAASAHSAPTAAAKPNAWAGTPAQDVSADERRALRSAREAKSVPGADDVAAQKRWIVVIEQRIAWAQRFGDDTPEAAKPT